MKNIPPVDLTRQHKIIDQEIESQVIKVFRSGRYIGGTAVTDFEQNFAGYLGVSHGIGCNSGTDALYMALRALNVGEGDEVITTAFTFIATSEVIVRVGAKPIFVDLEVNGFNFDLQQVAAAITEHTKAIIAVHLFGQPVNMDDLMAIANKHQIPVIEDCAQATGAAWNGTKVGSIGVGCFSFFPTKNLGGCGDGGAVTTDDWAIADQIRLLREHGLVRGAGAKVTYRHDLTGLNSRLDSIQAAILDIKLRHLDSWNGQRRFAANNYTQLLENVPNIKLPQEVPGSFAVWNQYTIRIPNRNSDSSITRDVLRNKLQEKGVISMVYYPLPLHLQPVYQDLGYDRGILPRTEQAAQEVLSLPMFPGITFAEQQQVAYSLKDCLEQL
ncbi:DegT/DnrJ/EryC1/StrS aminotransferase family protein [Xenococcus sp. PCC 7305]|uniref:DegT/DnrJ/EryC1/StrS family aminotransferase n=1 Tax=Xenococcus sp. PCC 7305 TaxID=102125 RepID=UPI0005939CFD|nr:DegT/DnrJ/EryC1/StrS family aminotransferase [Xenococcus sp. PCC 7305]